MPKSVIEQKFYVDAEIMRELGSIDARLTGLESNVEYIRKRIDDLVEKKIDPMARKIYTVSGVIAVIVSVLGIIISKYA